jgi:hypothetical protein
MQNDNYATVERHDNAEYKCQLAHSHINIFPFLRLYPFGSRKLLPSMLLYVPKVSVWQPFFYAANSK